MEAPALEGVSTLSPKGWVKVLSVPSQAVPALPSREGCAQGRAEEFVPLALC